jgi:hypothetical protein
MAQQQVRAGVARAVVTPPHGVSAEGFSPVPLVEVRDELLATALVFDDGHTRAALVALDLLGLDTAFVRSAQQAIEDAAGVPAGHVLLACSHTHSAPAILRPPRPEDYMSQLRARIAGAVAAAARRLEPVSLALGCVDVPPGINVHRRVMGPSGVMALPNPDGPVDRRVHAVRLRRPDGSTLALLFRFACHPTLYLGNRSQISADYPGEARRLVEHVYGAPAAFVQGCTGDVRPWVVDAEGRFRSGTEADLLRMGRVVGAAAVMAAEAAAPLVGQGICAAGADVALPYDTPPSPEALREIVNAAERHGAEDLRWARETLARLDRGDVPAALTVRIQALAIGGLTIVALPAEVFTEIGYRVEERFGSHTLVASCTNGCVGYIGTAQAVRDGGYETRRAHRFFGDPAGYGVGAETAVVEGALWLRAALST